MRKPSLTSPCVADRYSGHGERRAEFSFPDHSTTGDLPGGLLLLKDRGPDLPPLVQLYNVTGCEVVTGVTTTPQAYLDRFPPEHRATADRAYQDGFSDGANDKES